MDIFFVNNIPLLITLSHNIHFTATSCLSTKTAKDIFKYFWHICVLYLKRGFKITPVHSDGEFAPVRELVAETWSVPIVNLTSAKQHVPEIEHRIQVVK